MSASNNLTVAVIGAGPAGLMSAEVLSQAGIHVEVYDAMPTAARKLLMAGKGGLNITHSEPYGTFLTRFGGRRQNLQPILDQFKPGDLTQWVEDLGIRTFVGSSGRVFPADMKAAPLLRTWLHRLKKDRVQFYMRHRWMGWVDGDNQKLLFLTPEGERSVQADAVVLALGGASWPKLGSSGDWVRLLSDRNVAIKSFIPSNCGFQVNWSELFRRKYAGIPLKSVSLTFIAADGQAFSRHGEFIVTEQGVEGSLIYAMSSLLRDAIASSGQTVIYLDLLPDRRLDDVVDRLKRPRGRSSMANHLRKNLTIQGVKAGLLRELVPSLDFNDAAGLAESIKALPIKLTAPMPLEEAISSAGGVAFESLDERLMIRSQPGVFIAGEMLDWEAPTGGYLLSACF
ncbi:MAG: TIGR03862 family flavoprotein, partial [Gammaproteobacteria bacterium]